MRTWISLLTLCCCTAVYADETAEAATEPEKEVVKSDDGANSNEGSVELSRSCNCGKPRK